MADQSKIDKIVGMLGSEHDGERANAAALLGRMALADKITIQQMLRGAYGGGGYGGERIVYRDRIVEKEVIRERVVEKIVYRSPPTYQGTKFEQYSDANLDEEVFIMRVPRRHFVMNDPKQVAMDIDADLHFKADSHAYSTDDQPRNNPRREEAYQAYKANAYNGDGEYHATASGPRDTKRHAKITEVIKYHSHKLAKTELDFLYGVLNKGDTADLTARQMAMLNKIYRKVGMG